MRTVRLVGELGKKFGEVHRFDVKTPAEAVRALSVNFKGFREELMTSEERNVGYKVITGDEELEENQLHDPAGKEIVFVPVVMGAGAVARIIVGAVLIVAGAVMIATGVGAGAAPYLISAGAGLVLGGVVQLLSPVPKAPKAPEKPENTPSYVFNGPVNTTAQGHPVPVGYGRLRVGGALISAGISVLQLKRGFIRKMRERSSVKTYDVETNPSGQFTQNVVGTVPRNYYRKEVTYTKELNIYGMWTYHYTETYYWYETYLVEA